MSNVSIMRSIINDLANEKRISLIENPGVTMPDQRSLRDQLWDLHSLANRNKLYDAADWLKRYLEK